MVRSIMFYIFHYRTAEMSIFSCCVRKVPDVKQLDYRHNGLGQVPAAVFNAERTIEELHVDANQIKALPRVSERVAYHHILLGSFKCANDPIIKGACCFYNRLGICMLVDFWVCYIFVIILFDLVVSPIATMLIRYVIDTFCVIWEEWFI